ncbi:MAG: SCO family protein [Silicimonas sp.]|jgi:protein SCO1/2|nr:SCO family protein [Silicimonas sp.]
MSPKKLRILLWGLVAINLAALAWVMIISPRMNARVIDSLGQGDYVLQTTSGQAFTEATLQNGPSAVFFGFTHCPDVCPTTLGDILTWQEEYPAAAEMGIYFVTVDPERDTAEILGEYVGWVDGVEGVTGSREELDKTLEAFRIYAAKVPLDDGGYTMDHSASVLLFDRKGRYTDRIRYQEDPASAVKKLRTAIEG